MSILERLGPEQVTARDLGVVGAASAAVAALAVVALFLHDTDSAGDPERGRAREEVPAGPASTATPATAGGTADVDVFALQVGTCYLELDAELGVVRPEACSRAHDGELYHRFSVARIGGGATFPGNARIEAAADEACTTHFAVFVGTAVERSAFTYLYWYPDETDWSTGLRDVLCVVVAQTEGQKLDASARDARR